MNTLPTISIVVTSYNQAQYLPETLQSLVDQEYPSLEVVIQDGGSSDGSKTIAEDFVNRYPTVFRLFVEKDSGQADALNRGFARATGEILAFLNSDDTYFPHTLHRVVAEIDPTQGRYVIMGRCLFTGEGSRYAGIEHPAEYLSHFEHLAIWKRGFNTIPQPSVFWHREVWQSCGGLDVNEHHALDYDLFCRFSQHYFIHRIDELFSTYRMHDSSKTSQRTEAEVLDLSINVSRKYWGTWLAPLRWRCELSYWLHCLQLHERARHHARRAEVAFTSRKYALALTETVRTLLVSPRMARDRLLYGWLAARGVNVFERLAVVNEGFTGRYSDGWIGPVYREQISVPEDGQHFIVTATHYPQPGHKKINVQFLINDILSDSKIVEAESSFNLSAHTDKYRGQTVSLQLRTNSFFVPSKVHGGVDNRYLSLILNDITINGVD